ncbi:hypothetical protein F511_40033 [Dorcoceras hygrometricum]|uniref:Uncharacterized protein n=1 Tax=Dorcoceras hygrometricum TaxID=472368 RepID=A0A2Z7A999_9LAMI|nr:hypothetical protein F511_40033 [Dorcoceras hygrometricum]
MDNICGIIDGDGSYPLGRDGKRRCTTTTRHPLYRTHQTEGAGATRCVLSAIDYYDRISLRPATALKLLGKGMVWREKSKGYQPFSKMSRLPSVMGEDKVRVNSVRVSRWGY